MKKSAVHSQKVWIPMNLGEAMDPLPSNPPITAQISYQPPWLLPFSWSDEVKYQRNFKINSDSISSQPNLSRSSLPRPYFLNYIYTQYLQTSDFL